MLRYLSAILLCGFAAQVGSATATAEARQGAGPYMAAAVGAVAGVVGGVAAQQRRVEQMYYAVYYDCIARRRY